MRIISKYKDYYDSASGYGVDMSVVYSRAERHLNYDVEADKKIMREIDLACAKATNNDRFKHMYLHGNYDLIYVGVAGKIYVGLRFKTRVDDKDKQLFVGVSNPEIQFDDLYAWKAANLNDKQLDTPCGKCSWHNTGTSTPREWFAQNEAVRVFEDVNLFASNDIVSFVKYGHSCRDRGGPSIILNPCLHALGFQRMVDGFTVFQEISMFVTGVLAQKDQMTHTATDKELLYARGHDDMSFKTPPTKKR